MIEAATQRERVLVSYRRHVNRGIARLASLMGSPVEVRSEGPYVFDGEENRYLDCGGYGVFTLGHRHPRVIAAAHRQLDLHPLGTRLLLHEPLALASEALARVTPPGLDYVYLASTGAEAVETALKLARLHGITNVIAMRNGFHGKTLGALSVTGREAFQAPFRPLLPGVEFIDFGDVAVLATALERSGPACVLLEPVQAEGGVVLPPDGYLRKVESLCRSHGALLVLDEIQTGLGRLGAWWGADRAGVVPDVLLAGKALGGGVVPASAVIATARAFAPLNHDPFVHTSTFAGSPLVAATVVAALEAIEEDDIVERAARLGDRLLTGVRDLAAGVGALVHDVRGAGLLIGIELDRDDLAGELVLELLRRRVIVSHSLNANRVVRLTPPAILDDGDVAWLLEALAESLASVLDTCAMGSSV